MRRLLFSLILLASLTPFARPARAEGGLTITKQQYQLYRDYQDALQDERVQKMKPQQRLPAIAKNFHVKQAELEQAIALGQKEGDQVGPSQEAAIKSSFAGTPLEGKVSDVKVDAKSGHIIASILWLNSDLTKADQEACWAAARAAKAAPLVGTFALQANDAANKDKKVFSALIGADRAGNIHEDQIVDFASTRYIKLFEKREVASAP